MFKIFAFAILIAGTSATFWRGCADIPTAIPPNNIVSEACDEATGRCRITRGERLLADVYITPIRVHSRLDVRVTAFIFGVGVNLPQDPPHDDACNSIHNLNRDFIGCPTVPNVEVFYIIDMVIPTTYPAFQNTRVRFELLENGVVEGCADVTADLL